MSALEIFAKSILWVCVFGGICLVLGKSVPDRWLLANTSRALQQALIGWSLMVVALRLPFREHLPTRMGVYILAAIGIYSMTKWIMESASAVRTVGISTFGKSFKPREPALLVACLVVILPCLLIAYFPLFASGAVFYQYRGPDLDGDLMSASYVLDRNTIARLTFSLQQATGSFHGWDLRLDPWTIPDFREAVSIEFFLRSLRWGHAVLTAFVCRMSGSPVWFGFLVVTVFSMLLFPLVILDACRARGIGLHRAVLLSIAVAGSQTCALMIYEGVAVQMIATPVLLFCILSAKAIVLEPSPLGTKFVLAILLSALLSTFGEGVQIFTIFAGVLVALYYAFGSRLSLPRAPVLLGSVAIFAFWIALGPAVVVDFILWSYWRLKEAFIGGALHFNWSVLSLLLSLPYMALGGRDGLHLLVGGGLFIRVMELCGLLAVGGFLIYRRRGLEFTASVISLGVFVLINHRYAIWKSAAVLQPLFLATAFTLLPERIKALPKQWILVAVCTFSLGGLAALMWQYHRHADRVRPGQFAVSQLPNERVAIVTPSQSRVYMKLGSLGELYWVNNWAWRRGDLAPDFSIGGAQSLPVVLYFDCDGEGEARCAAIKAFAPDLPHRTMVPMNVPVSSLLDQRGFVDQRALTQFVRKSFGVEPLANQRLGEVFDTNRMAVVPPASTRRP